MGRILLIGDVHGCARELEDLLAILDPGADDRVVLVGDLVAKGPDSQAVVQLARERGLLAVRGNHDGHVLRWKEPDEGGKALKPVHRKVAESLGKKDWEYLESRPLILPDLAPGLVAVHAGLVPGVPLAKQDPFVLLNVRSLDANGLPNKRVDGGVPWASAWKGPEFVVFGHDAVRGLQRHPHALGLDTGCVYGRELTAFVWPERRLVSVKARRAYAEMKGD